MHSSTQQSLNWLNSNCKTMQSGLDTARCVLLCSTSSNSRLALRHCTCTVTSSTVRLQRKCSPQYLSQAALAPSSNSFYLDHATFLPMRRAHSSLNSLTMQQNCMGATSVCKTERERSSWSCKWPHLRKQVSSRSPIKTPRKWLSASLLRELNKFYSDSDQGKAI